MINTNSDWRDDPLENTPIVRGYQPKQVGYIDNTDPYVVAAKVMWEQRSGSTLVTWDNLTELGQDILVKAARAIIRAWETANRAR